MMIDVLLASLFVALLADAGAWIFTLRAISRQLQERHPGPHATIFGTPARRKNGMDRLFGLIGFLAANGDAALRDGRLSLSCVLLKIFTVLFFVIFVAMMFGPFFLRLE